MKLTNQYIFILGTTKFDNPYESASYTIAKYLAKDNYVFYIENPFTWKDYFQFRKKDEFVRRKDYFSPASDGILSTQIPNLSVIITPLLLSINFLPDGKIYRRLLKINESIIAERIKKVISKKKIEQIIYINSFNFHYPSVSDSLNPLLAAYHCVDPLILPFDRKHGVISEQTLLKKSDIVICTSKQLFHEKKELNKNTFFIPNAADISHSGKALDSHLKVHPSILHLKKPVIGYLGNIERRIDFSLIRKVALQNPDKSFVFAGPMSMEFIPEWFLNTANIHTTGRFDYDQLPAILKGFDVAIIPFKKDEVSNTIFPLKLFEYLGAGKPVISTNFNPDLQEFTKGTVTYCSDADEFSAAINEEVTNNTPEKMEARLLIAKDNTWEKRITELSSLLNSKIKTTL